MDSNDSTWSCMARRGMLFSECEGIDLLSLVPDQWVGGQGRDGICEAYVVLSGEVELDNHEHLADGQMLLIPDDDPQRPRFRAVSPTKLLTISVLADRIAQQLPRRTPEMTS